MWWHRPSWLFQPEDLWPRQKSLLPTIETCEEERKVALMTIAVNEPCGIEKVVEINKYSTALQSDCVGHTVLSQHLKEKQE